MPHHDGVVQIRPLFGINTYLMSALMDEDLRGWFRYIEPRVGRYNMPCWDWKGRMQYFGSDKQYAYPTVYVHSNKYDERSSLKMVYVRRYVARMFWTFPQVFVIYTTCRTETCINPHHYDISVRNNPEYR